MDKITSTQSFLKKRNPTQGIYASLIFPTIREWLGVCNSTSIKLICILLRHHSEMLFRKFHFRKAITEERNL